MKRSARWYATNGVTPAPVYEGTVACAWSIERGKTYLGPRTLRMSCWHQKGKGLDFDTSRDIVGTCIQRRFGLPMIDGYLHHRKNGLSVTTRDPLFSGELVKKTRKPSAKVVLRDLLAWLDGEHESDEILELARDIAA